MVKYSAHASVMVKNSAQARRQRFPASRAFPGTDRMSEIGVDLVNGRLQKWGDSPLVADLRRGQSCTDQVRLAMVKQWSGCGPVVVPEQPAQPLLAPHATGRERQHGRPLARDRHVADSLVRPLGVVVVAHRIVVAFVAEFSL